MQVHKALKDSALSRECEIVRKGLACDWDGFLFPCHRAVELGPDFAFGSVRTDVDTSVEMVIRERIEKMAFQSVLSQEHSNVSFCPVTIVQTHGRLEGEPNQQFCRMIEVKHKLVAKHHYSLDSFEKTLRD